MAASFAKARTPERQAVLTFAKNLGLASQISDDIFDATANPEQVGKDTGKDLGKTTFITFCGLEGARSLANELIDTAVSSLAPLKNRGELLRMPNRRPPSPGSSRRDGRWSSSSFSWHGVRDVGRGRGGLPQRLCAVCAG